MNTKKHLVLIVEDEISLRNALKTKLAKEGFDVLEAANGKEGYDLAISKKPDLILLDIIMPIMDGVSMLKILRKNKWGKTAKVIILSNLTDPFKETDIKEADVSSYLIKTNWRLGDLINVIRRTLT